MSEYLITAVDPEAREWVNPSTGMKVYYITVGLEGHEKPVSIGKKSPDALKVGDTVHGKVIETEHMTDKWEHEKLPQTSSQPYKSKPDKADYEPGTNARWAIGMAYRAYIQATGSPEGADGEFPFDAVEKHASELVRMFKKIKDNADWVEEAKEQLE